MTSPRGPIKVPVNDKRRVAAPEADEVTEARGPDDPVAPVEQDAGISVLPADDATEQEGQQGYLDDLKRLQAEFDNYRKRMMREQGELTQKATARVVEGLLPVLDDFERALEHGAEPGVELVYRRLRDALAQVGVEEVDSEGKPFDPTFHEAVDSVEDASVDEVVCRVVYRRGYRMGDRLLRPAMVGVARPPEVDGDDDVAT